MQFKVMLPRDVEQRFREAAMRRYGYRKGALGKAAEDAVRKWSGRHEGIEKHKKEIGDPVEAISGLLKGVKMSSVELQHSVGKIRAERYAAHRR